jgi:anti-sigma B factor antagonist
MKTSERAVIVREFPERCNSSDSRGFLEDLQHRMAQTLHPAIVLDCFNIRRLDRCAMQLFLSSLEEAMKRNGDVRIAAVHPDALQLLESAGVARLFRIFSSVQDAVNSYHRPTFENSAPAGEIHAVTPNANAA